MVAILSALYQLERDEVDRLLYVLMSIFIEKLISAKSGHLEVLYVTFIQNLFVNYFSRTLSLSF